MNVDNFKEYIENDLQWHWSFSSDNPLTVLVEFDSTLPDLDFPYEATARLIAPGFRQNSLERGYDHFGGRHGGSISAFVPRWYPLPDSGWHNFNVREGKEKFTCSPKSLNIRPRLTSVEWSPFGSDVSLPSVVRRYCHRYCSGIVCGKYGSQEDTPLSEFGQIRYENLNVYLSIVLTFVEHRGDFSQILGRSWGVPISFVSGEMM